MHGLTGIAEFITATLQALGYLGIVILMAIESACIPLPSEIIMPFSGLLVAEGKFTLWGAGLAGAAGCTLGSTVAYVVGAIGGRPLVLHYGRFILLSKHDVDMADHWFHRFGSATVFFTRLMPVVRTFISLPAGIARMPFGHFLVYTFAGSLIWSLFLAFIGLKLGQNWQAIEPIYRRFDYLFAVLILLLIALYVYRHVRSLHQDHRDDPVPERSR